MNEENKNEALEQLESKKYIEQFTNILLEITTFIAVILRIVKIDDK